MRRGPGGAPILEAWSYPTASGRSECQVCGCHTSESTCGNCGSGALLALATPDTVEVLDSSAVAALYSQAEVAALRL